MQPCHRARRRVAEKDRLVLGRANAGKIPDVDLTRYRAFEKGVSTMHVALERGSDWLMIIDLASTNGTYLNRKRLDPSKPVRVLDGADHIPAAYGS